MKNDYLVVGAYNGSVWCGVCARGEEVGTGIDRWMNIADIVYTEDVEGIYVYKYGVHIFRTNGTEL